MSMTLWLNIRNGETYESNGEDHSAVFYLQEPLDALADKLNVTPLSAFYDDTDVRYNMDETGEFEDCEEGWSASVANWFPAAAVLSSVSVILDHLQTNPNALTTADGWKQDDAIDELTDFRSELERVAAQSSTVHLCIVM
ncbi:hypothetical protein U737_03895 [Methylomonas sp. LW13]|uniref:hypothetical protein n=1 Tax=unclassified Methylomonas TaxID=2608980 RepID=UPI00051C7872|nr:hypothetical protein [Methylomonas sp. LW13]QBC26130.1 hypothetical protein U737_03895 [Methylomonas sp. LW13]